MKTLDLTEGKIFKSLIYFSVPMIAGNMLQQVYNLADTFIVGRYIGTDALAAVGSAYALMVFITSVIIGLCMGNGAFFSEDRGRKDNRQLTEDIGLSFCFVFFVTVIMYLIIYPFVRPIQKLMQIPGELTEMSVEYVTIIVGGLIFVFLYNFFAYLLRAMGNSAVPLIFLSASSALNVILDIWFVVGAGMGVDGAAWATVISQGVSGIGIAVYSFLKVPFLKEAIRSFKWNKARLKSIAINDFATAIQQSVMNFGILMIQGLVNSFGAIVMASFSAAVKIDTLAYMPAQEFSNAYSLFISQNHGAEKKKRIESGTKTALAASFVFCLLISCIIFVFAEELMGVFVGSSNGEIIAEGSRYLRIEGAAYVGIGILFLWYGYFRGISKPYVSLLLTIISLGTRVALSYTLAPHTSLGVTAIWLSIPIGWILADVSGYMLYRKTTKKKG